MKNKKTVIIVIVIIVLLFVFRYAKSRIENAKTSKEDEGAIYTTPKSPVLTVIDNNTILKKEMAKNDRVKWVQNYFNKYVAPSRGLAKITYDGVFGSKTEDAVFKTLGKKTTTWTEFKSHVDSNYNN